MDNKEETRKLLRKYGDELLVGLDEIVSSETMRDLETTVDQVIEEIIGDTLLDELLRPLENLDFTALLAERNGFKPDEPYVNSVDTNDFLDDSLMSHIIDDIYQHASRRGWERCVIRVEQEVVKDEQTSEEKA